MLFAPATGRSGDQIPGPVAVIDERGDHGPIRAVAPGSGVRPTGVFASQKSGRGLPWESKLELHGLWWAEARTEVIESWCQPCRIWLQVGPGKPVSYVPDRKDRLANGLDEFVEVKPRFSAEKNPAYTEKLRQAQAVLVGLGHRFRIVERAEIEAEPGFSTVKLIQAYRRTRITPVDLQRTREAFAGADAMPRGALQEALGGPLGGLPTICALVVQRHLSLDLEFGFVADAPLHLVRGV